MTMQLNFRSAHLYAIIPTKQASHSEMPEHLGAVILVTTAPECDSVENYGKMFTEAAREKRNCDLKSLSEVREGSSSEIKQKKENYQRKEGDVQEEPVRL